jgi:hypothetical protein
MSILGWIVLGGVAGWIGSLLINKTGEGLFRDIVVGIVGAVVGDGSSPPSGPQGWTAPDKGIPEHLWRRAECVLVISPMKKAVFILGGEYGSE